jgi:hypothetical protein
VDCAPFAQEWHGQVRHAPRNGLAVNRGVNELACLGHEGEPLLGQSFAGKEVGMFVIRWLVFW